ncbi:ATP-binding protein [Streptomyces sp. NBC_01275]|uniref:ATP-binding protein n=1 Tax=Streptomyces sp. NBC_01275 TaxID=2903807 RepID=UPI0022588005|nr:ATP-binding protein [Streptomyces sp. NBC_01275]MCX4763705.1 ATP-binding protein [Streptomyces sp. NBC_01275]
MAATSRQLGASSSSEETGRGLHLVHAYADDWGWFQVNGVHGGDGTYVWCELNP